MQQNDISYSVSGSEKKGTIVALHGVTDNAASLSDLAAHWKKEWRVILCDTLGHGLSRSFTKKELSAPFDSIVSAMAPTIVEAARTSRARKVVLFGHSLGGAVASRIARDYPELIEALILEDPALLTPEFQRLYREGASCLAERQQDVTDHVGNAIVELMRHYDWPPSEYGAWAQGKTQVDRAFVATGVVGILGRDVLAELAVPTLLVTGDGSDVFFGSEGLKEIKSLANPLLTSSLILNASHTVRRDQPSVFYSIVEDFLNAHCSYDGRAPIYIADELRPVLESSPPQSTADIESMRHRADALLSHVRPAEGIEVESVFLTTDHSFELRCLATDLSQPKAVVLSVHGGGYVSGAARYDDERNSALVATFGDALVASPDYGLAPEYPWPAGALDCCEALRYLRRRYPDQPLYVYGDSAGAGLARQAIEMIARAGEDVRIERLILLEPCMEPQMNTLSFNTYSDGPIWTREASTTAWKHCIGDTPARLPYIPSREAMSFMPPTMLVVNPSDPLRDEGIRLAKDLADAGVPVEMHMFPGTFHGALSAPGTLTWRRVRKAIADFVSAPV